MNFRFTDIVEHEYAGREFAVANFHLGSEKFVLCPGEKATLGFDVDAFVPTQDQIDSLHEDDSDWTLQQYLAYSFTPKRVRKIPTLLVAKCRRNQVWQTGEFDDPIFDEGFEALQSNPSVGSISSLLDHAEVRIDRSDDGSFKPITRVFYSMKEVQSSLSDEGLRLPSADEWEYVCGAGSKTVFPWGDSISSDNPLPSVGPESRKLFGLIIADSDRGLELVSDHHFIRGGDGGAANAYGCCGPFVSELPYSHHYYMKDEDLFSEAAATRFASVRPVFQVPQI